MSRIIITAVATTVLLAGCAVDEKPVEDTGSAEILTCPAYNPRDGIARLDMMPGIDTPPILHVEFVVDAPSLGDEYELVFESIQESAPPSYVYDLKRTESDVISTKPAETLVTYNRSAFPEAELRSIVINCEGSRFYEIEPVDVVH